MNKRMQLMGLVHLGYRIEPNYMAGSFSLFDADNLLVIKTKDEQELNDKIDEIVSDLIDDYGDVPG